MRLTVRFPIRKKDIGNPISFITALFAHGNEKYDESPAKARQNNPLGQIGMIVFCLSSAGNNNHSFTSFQCTCCLLYLHEIV